MFVFYHLFSFQLFVVVIFFFFFFQAEDGIRDAQESRGLGDVYKRQRMDPLGLLHALKEIENSFEDRTGISLEIKNNVPHLDLTAEQEDQIFHIIQAVSYTHLTLPTIYSV